MCENFLLKGTKKRKVLLSKRKENINKLDYDKTGTNTSIIRLFSHFNSTMGSEKQK